MGWARYAHSMRVFCMNSGLFFIRPTEASMDLLKRTVERIDMTGGWDQAIFNEVPLPPNPYVAGCPQLHISRIFICQNFIRQRNCQGLALLGVISHKAQPLACAISIDPRLAFPSHHQKNAASNFPNLARDHQVPSQNYQMGSACLHKGFVHMPFGAQFSALAKRVSTACDRNHHDSFPFTALTSVNKSCTTGKASYQRKWERAAAHLNLPRTDVFLNIQTLRIFSQSHSMRTVILTLMSCRCCFSLLQLTGKRWAS